MYPGGRSAVSLVIYDSKTTVSFIGAFRFKDFRNKGRLSYLYSTITQEITKKHTPGGSELETSSFGVLSSSTSVVVLLSLLASDV